MRWRVRLGFSAVDLGSCNPNARGRLWATESQEFWVALWSKRVHFFFGALFGSILILFLVESGLVRNIRIV